MAKRIINLEDRGGGQPQHIADVLADLFVQYEGCLPPARAETIETPAVMEDQSCLFYPAELASVS